MKEIKLKWVIAHEPAYLFYRVAEDFKNIVNSKTSSFKIDIEILRHTEYNERYNPTVEIGRNNLWKALQDNTVQFAQMTTSSLGRQFNREMQVYDMPYIFDNHEHAAEILEGEIGEQILNSFEPESKLKGLAYTYSGGFRLMPVKDSVVNLTELAGQPVRSGWSEIAQDTIRAFGMNPIPTEIEQVTSTVKRGEAVAAEHVAQRLLPDNCQEWTDTIIDTEHSLFLTSIVVNRDWWNSLDSELQEIFSSAALEAARNERELSIRDGIDSIEKMKKLGVKYVTLDKEQRSQLVEKTKSVYEKYQRGYFSENLIEKIKKQ
jgi:TRAP-type C4-dicarboxylate transport system substrate-binding protein